MTKVIAALDNSLAARPVLWTALALGAMVGAEVEPLHVGVDGDRIARGVAAAAGLELRTTSGPVVERLIDLGEADDVLALVLGARGTPAGARPLGGTALAVATSVAKPVVVVPPEAGPLAALRRVLVPIEGVRPPELVPGPIVRLGEEHRIDEVVVLHVHEETSLPAFTDQPQHEHRAWSEEFLCRYCPWESDRVRFEVRVGRAEELILRLAQEAEVDLIALGWSQRLAPGQARIVRAALARGRTPVLLVPAGVPAGPRS